MLKGKKHRCGAKKNCPLKLKIILAKEKVLVVCSRLYSITWIDPTNKKLHEDENLREYGNETANEAAPYAYEDDLATCSAVPQAEYMQQLQANWL
jgi:hypothetical protein